jgi:hypothetical protein
MYSDEHAQHNTCATPGCATFHLFCPTCGGRHHLDDEYQSAQPTHFPAAARNTMPAPVSLTAQPAGANTA